MPPLVSNSNVIPAPRVPDWHEYDQAGTHAPQGKPAPRSGAPTVEPGAGRLVDWVPARSRLRASLASGAGMTDGKEKPDGDGIDAICHAIDPSPVNPENHGVAP
jgi:hypothetical protein